MTISKTIVNDSHIQAGTEYSPEKDIDHPVKSDRSESYRFIKANLDSLYSKICIKQ